MDKRRNEADLRFIRVWIFQNRLKPVEIPNWITSLC